jgi:hypothetical protein
MVPTHITIVAWEMQLTDVLVPSTSHLSQAA